MKRGRVLVVDDKENFLALFRRIAPADLDVVCASDGARALALLSSEPFDVVVADIRMPGADGMTLLQRVRQTHLGAEVILMTAYGTIAESVRAMKIGAVDYLTKPFQPAEALAAIEVALVRRRGRRLATAQDPSDPEPRLLGTSGAVRRVRELIECAAQSDATVLITGESGTGKELVARAIHAKSPRSNAPFVAVNCGALPEALIESELFGHARGAFTGALASKRGLFQEASGGVLFLDEIGELPVGVQVKLTRALQERAIRRVGESEEHHVDVRIVAATNVDLARAVGAGRFREDLFYRVNVLAIPLPPLRERRDDVPLLAQAFLERTMDGSRAGQRSFAASAIDALVAYGWPGNVRQLENAVARAVAVSSEPVLDADVLPPEITNDAERPTSSLSALTYKEAIALQRDRTTRDYLMALLRAVQGNVTAAAERAGIERESFHRLMKRHGVRAEDFRGR